MNRVQHGVLPTGQEIFLISKASRPAVATTQSPTEWIPEALYPGSTRTDVIFASILLPSLRIIGAIPPCPDFFAVGARIAQSLRTRQPKNYRSIPSKGKRFSIFRSFQTCLGPTQPHIHCTAGAVSSGVKRSERETDHSLPSVADVRNAWHDISTLLHAFTACTETAIY